MSSYLCATRSLSSQDYNYISANFILILLPLPRVKRLIHPRKLTGNYRRHYYTVFCTTVLTVTFQLRMRTPHESSGTSPGSRLQAPPVNRTSFTWPTSRLTIFKFPLAFLQLISSLSSVVTWRWTSALGVLWDEFPGTGVTVRRVWRDVASVTCVRSLYTWVVDFCEHRCCGTALSRHQPASVWYTNVVPSSPSVVWFVLTAVKLILLLGIRLVGSFTIWWYQSALVILVCSHRSDPFLSTWYLICSFNLPSPCSCSVL